MSIDTITKTVFFAASRDVVWSYLTESEKLAEWFHRAESDLEAGKDYALVAKGDDGSVSPQCWGSVLEMNKPSRIVYTFTIKPLSGKFTTVTWQLEEVQGGTKLTLIHEGVSEAAGEATLGLLQALDAGWDKHIAGLRSAAS